MIEIHFKKEIWVYGFPTIILSEKHAKQFARAFKSPRAIGYRFRGEYYKINYTKEMQT